jgi:hypothetical protein
MDLKTEGLGSHIAPIITKYGVQQQVIASCWTMTALDDAMLHMPNVSRQLLNDGGLIPKSQGEWPAFFQLLRNQYHLSGFSLGAKMPADFVVQARRRLFSVVVWTVNEVLSSTSIRLILSSHSARSLTLVCDTTMNGTHTHRVVVPKEWLIGAWMVSSQIIHY